MPTPTTIPSLAPAAAETQHHLLSRLLDGFADWWQPPAAIAATAAVVAIMLWIYRRDAAELPRSIAILLGLLRLAALAGVAVGLLDIDRIAEHEIVLPSRVAVLVDSSASMAIVDPPVGADPRVGAGNLEPPGPQAGGLRDRSSRGLEILTDGGLLAALAAHHEVSLWRFDADSEPLAIVPRGGHPPAEWQAGLVARGYETRIGEAVIRVLDREPASSLAGIVVLSDGGNNAGLDPLAAAAAAARAEVAIDVVGIGSDDLPTNVRVADLIAPARVFPGDAFAVTAYLQAQGMEGRRVEVELREQAGEPGDPTAATQPMAGRLIDTREAVLAADGELAALRFDVAGLVTPGSRTLTVRLRPPTADRSAEDDSQAVGIEVVDRVTQVLLIAGGPSREYQFMRNVLDRDPSFAVDVLLGTAAEGISQDARRILAEFPPADDPLADYDAVVAIDVDWLAIGPAGWSRLERWVSQTAGGLVLMAGGIHMDSWLGDPRADLLRGLFPVQLRRPEQVDLGGMAGQETPLALDFTRDGRDAEFLWLADSQAASATVWSEFPGVYACYPVTELKPGGTTYAEAVPSGGAGGDPRRIYLAGQYYGSGCVLYAGSSELWRLRGIDDATYERLVAQILRHVSHGRLAQGSSRTRLLVDRDRHPVGGTVQLRLVLADERLAASATVRPLTCRVTGPGGESFTVPLAAAPNRPDTLLGGFIASRPGSWRIEVDAIPGQDDRLVRRIQAQLPDRELARPLLDRPLLEQLASRTGGTAVFPEVDGWDADEALALAATFPDRSRREYEAGAADQAFKQRLNAVLLAIVGGCLCLEWTIRRLAKLA